MLASPVANRTIPKASALPVLGLVAAGPAETGPFMLKVTGASTGIGAELAACFARDGYDLVLAARSEAGLKSVAARLVEQFGVAATTIAVDLGRPGAGHALADDVASRGLGIDVVVNNAGYGIAGAFNGSDETAQLGMIDLNVRALVELTHVWWPGMLARRRGGVLNVASTAAFQPGPLMAVGGFRNRRGEIRDLSIRSPPVSVTWSW